MSNITYFLTDAAHLDSIDVAQGNLLFCEDTKKIYLDNDDRRVCYDSIMVFDTDYDRYYYPYPTDGFYFVTETKVLWRYDEDDGWTALTKPPTNTIEFLPKEDLPSEGRFGVLYVCGTEQYVWSPEESNYLPITANSVWREV